MTSEPQIELEIWDGSLNRRQRLSEPTPRALREALLRLDGHHIDCVWIEIESVGALTIGGGPAGFVVASFPLDGSSSHVVTGDDDGTTIQLQVGGQVGGYPRVMVLPSSWAFEIADRYLQARAFDPTLRWVKDCPAD